MTAPTPPPADLDVVAFDAREPGELTAGARRLSWDADHLAHGRRFRTDVTGVQAPAAQLARVFFRAPTIAQGCAPPRAYVLAMTAGQSGEATLDGERLHAGRLGVIRPDRPYAFRTTGEIDLILLSLPRERVDGLARELLGGALDPEGGASTIALVDPDRTRGLCATSTALLESCRKVPTSTSTDATRVFAATSLPELLIRDLALPVRSASELDRRGAARRAAGYLHERWRERIGLGELCRVARAPERTLRQGFAEVFGSSPVAYLRTLRLNAARERLLAQDDPSTVTEIALSCGFTHLGRFSVEYRRAFGETPSQTRSR